MKSRIQLITENRILREQNADLTLQLSKTKEQLESVINIMDPEQTRMANVNPEFLVSQSPATVFNDQL